MKKTGALQCGEHGNEFVDDDYSVFRGSIDFLFTGTMIPLRSGGFQGQEKEMKDQHGASYSVKQ